MKKIFVLLLPFGTLLTDSSCHRASNPTADGIPDMLLVCDREWDEGDRLNFWLGSDTQATPDMVWTYTDGVWQRLVRDGLLDDYTFSREGDGFKVVYESTNHLSETFSANSEGDGTWFAAYADDFTGCADDPAVQITAYQVPLVYYSMGEYRRENGVLQFEADDWSCSTPHKMVVTGLDSCEAGRYALQCDRMMVLSGGVKVKPKGVTQRVSWDNTLAARGMPDPEGVAFYFGSLTDDADGKAVDYTFTLYDHAKRTRASCSFSNVTLTDDETTCQVDTVAAAAFSEW